MHSSNAPDEFSSQPTAMGSVQNLNPNMHAHLEMIRPVPLLPDVSNTALMEAQGAAQLVFEMINVPHISSYETIADLTAMLQNTQQQIVVMISDGNCHEALMAQAIQGTRS